MGLLALIRRYLRVSVIFAGLMVIYVLFTLVPHPAAANLAKYHITANQDRALSLTIIIPYLAIWLMSLVGYLRLKHYSDLIKDTKDGAAFSRVSLGILALALWLPFTSALGAIFVYFYNLHPAATAPLVIINNYVNLAILVTAYATLDNGAKKFARVTRSPKNAPNQLMVWGFIIMASIYTWLSLADPVRRHPSHGVLQASYYEPDWLIVLTIIIPRLIMWSLGLQAVQNISYYRRKVKGLIYKDSLFRLSVGIWLMVVATILLRCLQSLMVMIDRLSLGLLLALVYLLLALIGAGSYLIAKGANNLLKIENT